MIPIDQEVMLAGLLFTMGGIGFLVRRNVLVSLMSSEIMLNDLGWGFQVNLSSGTLSRVLRVLAISWSNSGSNPSFMVIGSFRVRLVIHVRRSS